MPEKRTLSMQTVGYLLLIGGLALFLTRACVFFSSLNNVPPSPGPSTPPQPGLISASVENGTVYFVAQNNLYALRASDGKQIWHGFTNFFNPPTVANGVVYETDFREIVALRGSDGMLLWNYSAFDQSGAPPGNIQIEQIVGDRLYIYDGQTLEVLMAEQGRLAWSTIDPVNIININTLTISNGIAYYALHPKSDATPTTTLPDDAIVARRALDGKILWTYNASTAAQSCSIASMTQALNAIYASASCDNGIGRTFALRSSDGSLLWQSSMSGQISLTDGTVCLHITQASPTLADLYVLQASTGKLLWNDPSGTSQHQTQMWTPGNGYIYLLDNGTLSARRLSDGQPAWNMTFPAIAASQTFETFSDPVFLGALHNVIYIQSAVVNQNTHVAFNRLYALQANTGKQLWSFQQDQSNLTWTTFNIDATTGTISIQGLDAQHPTALYLLRATDGKLIGSVIQSQGTNNVIIANSKVYLTSIHGDGNNIPFSYQVKALYPDDQGGKTLWGFGA